MRKVWMRLHVTGRILPKAGKSKPKVSILHRGEP